MSNVQARAAHAHSVFRKVTSALVLSTVGGAVALAAAGAAIYSLQQSKSPAPVSVTAVKQSNGNDARSDHDRGQHHGNPSWHDGPPWHDHGKGLQLRLLSSPAKYGSGGDARIEVVAAPGLHDKLQWFLNGRRVDITLRSNGRRLEGIVSGFSEGRNVLEVHVKHSALRDALEITNYPI